MTDHHVYPQFTHLRGATFLSNAVQLLRIEEQLGDKAVYAGQSFRKPAWMA